MRARGALVVNLSNKVRRDHRPALWGSKTVRWSTLGMFSNCPAGPSQGKAAIIPLSRSAWMFQNQVLLSICDPWRWLCVSQGLSSQFVELFRAGFPKPSCQSFSCPTFPALATNLWCWPQICWNNQQERVDNEGVENVMEKLSKIPYFTSHQATIAKDGTQNISGFGYWCWIDQYNQISKICENCDTSAMTSHQDIDSRPHAQIFSYAGPYT